jgi:transcriptional regulator with XRE-family HTH domain
MQASFSLMPYTARTMATNGHTNGHDSRLRELREAAGLSQRELARMIGEQHTNVRYWELSGKPPRSDVLAPMAQALGVTVEDVLGLPRSRTTAPGGKLAQVFTAAAKLPRRQQQKIIEFVEPFIRHHAKGEAVS